MKYHHNNLVSMGLGCDGFALWEIRTNGDISLASDNQEDA